LDQVDVRVLKMALQAQKDMAKMLLEGVGQARELQNSTEGHVDLYV